MPDTRLPVNNLSDKGQSQSKSNFILMQLNAYHSWRFEDGRIVRYLIMPICNSDVNADGQNRVIQLSKGCCEPVVERKDFMR